MGPRALECPIIPNFVHDIRIQVRQQVDFDPSVTDGALERPLRRDCASLRARRISEIVSKGRAAVFLYQIEPKRTVKSHILSQFEKVCAMIFTNFPIFSTLRADRGRLTGHRSLKFVSNVICL